MDNTTNTTVEKLTSAVNQLMEAYEKLQNEFNQLQDENKQLKNTITNLEDKNQELSKELDVANNITTTQSSTMGSLLNKVEDVLKGVTNTINKKEDEEPDYNTNIPFEDNDTKEDNEDTTTTISIKQSPNLLNTDKPADVADLSLNNNIPPKENKSGLDLNKMESLLNGLKL
jgi:chromosome segregation ATPase